MLNYIQNIKHDQNRKAKIITNNIMCLCNALRQWLFGRWRVRVDKTDQDYWNRWQWHTYLYLIITQGVEVRCMWDTVTIDNRIVFINID